jgi:hypothetical protein
MMNFEERESNPRPPKYEVGVLITIQQLERKKNGGIKCRTNQELIHCTFER